MRKRTSTVLAFGLLVTAWQLSTAIPARAARSCSYVEFDKGSNINSDLLVHLFDQQARCSIVPIYRVGSGLTEDACQTNQGWLPNGWYDMTSTGMEHNYAGDLIRGRVWALQNKTCSDGTLRTQLFIHTEETTNNGQICTSDNDDPWCWDNTRADPGAQVGSNDYKSVGCIKVRRSSADEGNWNNDLGPFHSDWHDAWTGHNDGINDAVYVHN